MNEEQRAILLLASNFLGYPSDRFIEEGQALEKLVNDNIQSAEMKRELKNAYKPLFSLSSIEMKELYVDTFDLKEKLGLYLTAHELGDSNKRGAALIKLQKIINQAGFERVEGELADFIPMLFEYLAVAPETIDNERLYRRLAVAVQRMFSHIDKENPYVGVLQLLMKYVFPHPSKEEIEALEYNREEADLEEMPYPIMYQ